MTACIFKLLWLLQAASAPTTPDEVAPAPPQTFSFEDDEEQVQGHRDEPLIDWMCGVTKAKHKSLVDEEMAAKRFLPAGD